jgi:hypothetical protein
MNGPLLSPRGYIIHITRSSWRLGNVGNMQARVQEKYEAHQTCGSNLGCGPYYYLTVLKRKILITVTGKLECTMTTHLRLKKRREKGESSRVDYSLQVH